MSTRAAIAVPVLGVLLLVGTLAHAQGSDNAPPVVTGLSIDVYDDLGNFRFNRTWSSPFGLMFASIGNEVGFQIQEVYLLQVTVAFRDPDLVSFTEGNDNEPPKLERGDEEFFARKRSFPVIEIFRGFFFASGRFSFGGGNPPNPPPLDLAYDTGNFIAPPSLYIPPLDPNGLTDPNTPNDVAFITYVFNIPEFVGPSQQRLAGSQTYDVAWTVQIEIANTENPSDTDPRGSVSFRLFAIENPGLRPGNAPPFADAGGSGILARDPVSGAALGILDATASTDATNVGFNPSDPGILEKDRLTYDWEIYSYPTDWTGAFDITPFGDGTARAYVTLTNTRAGDVFEFRVLVRDGANPEPSTAIVRLTVSDPVAANRPPVANAGPDLTVGVNGTITLDGSGSTDPDGDTLTYLWRQTNAVGGILSGDQVSSSFQPVSGLNAVSSTWRALKVGTYYFRLIVSDSSGDSDYDDVVVVVSQNGPTSARELGPTSESSPTAAIPLFGFGLCGAGLTPVAIVPFALLPMRKRIR